MRFVVRPAGAGGEGHPLILADTGFWTRRPDHALPARRAIGEFSEDVEVTRMAARFLDHVH